MSKFLVYIFCFLMPFYIQAQTIEKTIFIPALKDNSNRYFYLPFEVPAQTKSLTVTYQYDKKNGANVLDLGVFDGGFDESENSVAGFRGWSGGRRNSIFIAENSATNGYIAGKIPTGVWRVVFGLYKVAPAGVEVAVKIQFNDLPGSLSKEPDDEENKSFTLPVLTKPPAPENFGGNTWFRGDLHVHTFHSDGSWTIPSVLEWASASGLNFVGITEHNTFSHHASINKIAAKYKNLLVLRGEEVTTYGGHFNVWGLPNGELVDFRVAPKDALRLQKIVDGVHRAKLLASINHPFALCGGCDWSYGAWEKMDAVEIWNGAWDSSDEAALKKWDALLQSGQKITAIGSSDSHTPPLGASPPANSLALGTPTVHVGMKNLTQENLLEAISNRRVWISRTTDDSRLEFSAENDGKKFYIGDAAQLSGKIIRLRGKAENFPAGAIVSVVSDNRILFSQPIAENSFDRTFSVEKDSYFRLEIRDADKKMLALTNPIFARVKK